jgi:hypothetical protein
VAEDLPGGPGAQPLGVVDPLTTGQGRGDQRHRLVAGVGRARRVAEVDVGVHSSKQEPLGQRGGQDQPSVGHRVVVVEGDGNRIGAVACSHRTGALLSPSR